MGSVIGANEIELNSVKYKINGSIKPILASKFADKMVVGDYTKASNPNVDSWVISDNRGGILAEEMDEATQANRGWWSTCNLSYLNHMVLPPLATAGMKPDYCGATLLNGGLEEWTDANDCDDWDESTTAVGGGAQATITREDTTKVLGTYGAKLYVLEGDPDHGTIAFSQTLAWDDSYQSTTAIFGFWLKRAYDVSDSGTVTFTVADGVDTTTLDIKSTYTDTDWHWAEVSHTVNAAATQLVIAFNLISSGADNAQQTLYVDAVCLASADTPADFANFNSGTYCAADQVLMSLSGTTWSHVALFPATITSLAASIGTNLYVFLGDSPLYWYMDTTETFTESNSANADLSIEWDSKLFKVNTTGQMAYSTDPNEAAPTWTNDGNLADSGLAQNDIQALYLDRDAAGDTIIYASTKKGLYAHSFGNDKWVETQLSLPGHGTTGSGATTWRDAAYISAGLDVWAYKVDAYYGTTISAIGLGKDDGLPQLRGGEIVKFIPGYNELFALVDSTYEGTTSRSTVMAYDGRGWQCVWESSAANVGMSTGIISSVSAYRLWFGAGTSLYYIPLQKNIRNPKKVATYTYATSGVHITPWFDANWVGVKNALRLKTFCKDTTANETVLVQYRIDHATTAIASTWTTLGTIAAAGDGVETEYTFGSSVGTNFKSIQFKLTLSRGSTTTLSPDVQYMVLEYQKILPPIWGWQFQIDCTHNYGGQTPEQLLDAVVTAAETTTLVPFVYEGSTSQYVRVIAVEGDRLTGEGQRGTYNVSVLEPV